MAIINVGDKEVNVVNGTVYDSQDIADYLLTVLPALENLKIRYLNSPYYNGLVVSLRHPNYFFSDTLEVGILRQSKLPESPIVALARAAVEDCATAPALVCEDLKKAALRLVQYTSYQPGFNDRITDFDRLCESVPPTIRVHEKAKGRKAATIFNLREKIQQRENSICVRHSKIAEAKETIENETVALASDISTLAEYEKKLAGYLAKAAEPIKKKAAV